MSLFSRLRGDIQQKSQQLSDALTERRRQRLGEDLAQEEERLKTLAAEIGQRERAVAEREARLNRVYLLPESYVQVPCGLAMLAGVAWVFYSFGPPLG